jgi:hypothetical protein
MDQEQQFDLGEVRRNVARAEVITLYFPYFRQTLVLDTRASASEGPLIRIRPMVNSVEERMRDLRLLRPRFGNPESVTLIPWPKYVRSLHESGIWAVLVDRLVQAGGAPIEVEMEETLRRLRVLEWREWRHAITGKGYKTVWQRSG